MSSELKISLGQYSSKGRKEINQDFHGAYVPEEPQLSAKGIAVALADGISSSDVSQVASETAVTSFLDDYFCTSEAWSVKKSAQQVLMATNSWLHSQTQRSQYRYERDRGYVCTFSALVLKSATAHIFHLGDARIYRLRGKALEQLTQDHRVWIAEGKSYLSRALGINPSLETDYESLPIEKGDVFLLATDGVYEFASAQFMVNAALAHQTSLDTAAKAIADEAYAQGSDDNLTVQLLRIDELPARNADEIYHHLTELPFPPLLEARAIFDGYTIVRELHASSRSHVYLAVDGDTGGQVVIKIPSIDLRGNPAYLESFLMEEWIARRIDSAHVLKPSLQTRKRNFLYTAVEYIDGRTLSQWMSDHPKRDLETVRGIVEQIGKGLRAFHRLEMLHQDLRPDNIMIDRAGTVKIIDFGSTRVAGIAEISTAAEQQHLQGTAQYAAPEYFLGESGSTLSDIFSLGVIAYQMLASRLPYGAEVAKIKSKAGQRSLKYKSAIEIDRRIPVWVDEALRKAVHPNPSRRHADLTEFLFDLRHPNREFLKKTRPPLIERDPVVFWKSISFLLAMIVLVLLGLLSGR